MYNKACIYAHSNTHQQKTVNDTTTKISIYVQHRLTNVVLHFGSHMFIFAELIKQKYCKYRIGIDGSLIYLRNIESMSTKVLHNIR